MRRRADAEPAGVRWTGSSVVSDAGRGRLPKRSAGAGMCLVVFTLGCARGLLGRGADTSQRRVEPVRVYASYRFETGPAVLNFGVQPLWIPTCVVWEVMARDQQLREDM